MNDQTNFQQHGSAPAGPAMSFKRPKSNLSRLAVPLVVVLVALAAAGGAWGWQQKNLNQLSSQKKDLSAQISSLTAENKTLAQSANPPANTVYKASVGKFTLTLPNKYVVVQYNDGGMSGGPATNISIAEKLAANNVVSFGPSESYKVSIFADERGKIYNNGGNPSDSLKRYIQEAEQRQGYSFANSVNKKITIDGVTAEAYMPSSPADPSGTTIFFTKNGINMYRITTSARNNITQQQLDAVIAGFKFNY